MKEWRPTLFSWSYVASLVIMQKAFPVEAPHPGQLNITYCSGLCEVGIAMSS